MACASPVTVTAISLFTNKRPRVVHAQTDMQLLNKSMLIDEVVQAVPLVYASYSVVEIDTSRCDIPMADTVVPLRKYIMDHEMTLMQEDLKRITDELDIVRKKRLRLKEEIESQTESQSDSEDEWLDQWLDQ